MSSFNLTLDDLLDRVPLEYWVTWSELGLRGVVVFVDHSRDDGFSADGVQVGHASVSSADEASGAARPA